MSLSDAYCSLLNRFPDGTEVAVLNGSDAQAREQLIIALKLLTVDTNCGSVSDDGRVGFAIFHIFILCSGVLWIITLYILFMDGQQALRTLEAYNLPVLSDSDLEICTAPFQTLLLTEKIVRSENSSDKQTSDDSTSASLC